MTTKDRESAQQLAISNARYHAFLDTLEEQQLQERDPEVLAAWRRIERNFRDPRKVRP